MLALGQGWGIELPPASGASGASGWSSPSVLAASTVVLPYGPDFAWISMVLVLPEFRRRGYASRLLEHALATLKLQGRAAVLDATPAGHAVYAQAGFVDTWGFARFRREAVSAATSGPVDAPASPRLARPHTRPLTNGDWPAIAALDLPAFGADRLPLLQALARRMSALAHVVEEDGHISGYVLGRDGRDAVQIGPLLAARPEHATALLSSALAAVSAPGSGPVYVDLLDGRPDLLAQIQAAGFVFQRPFTRMVHGRRTAPGDATQVMMVAGPELG